MTLLHREDIHSILLNIHHRAQPMSQGEVQSTQKFKHLLIHFEIPSTLFSLISLHPYLMLLIDIQFDTSLTKKFLIT